MKIKRLFCNHVLFIKSIDDKYYSSVGDEGNKITSTKYTLKCYGCGKEYVAIDKWNRIANKDW